MLRTFFAFVAIKWRRETMGPRFRGETRIFWVEAERPLQPELRLQDLVDRGRVGLVVEAHRGIPLLRHASPQGDVLATWHRWQKATWISPNWRGTPRTGLRVGDAGCG